MPAHSKKYLSVDFLNTPDLPSDELLSKAIDKLKTIPKTSPEFRNAFHCINVLISLMLDSDPNKGLLIKRLYSTGEKKPRPMTRSFKNPTQPFNLGF
jgi:hypothetical protein